MQYDLVIELYFSDEHIKWHELYLPMVMVT